MQSITNNLLVSLDYFDEFEEINAKEQKLTQIYGCRFYFNYLHKRLECGLIDEDFKIQLRWTRLTEFNAELGFQNKKFTFHYQVYKRFCLQHNRDYKFMYELCMLPKMSHTVKLIALQFKNG